MRLSRRRKYEPLSPLPGKAGPLEVERLARAHVMKWAYISRNPGEDTASYETRFLLDFCLAPNAHLALDRIRKIVANGEWSNYGDQIDLIKKETETAFASLPAPAALSVQEYAAQFKWAVARFSENVGAAEWVTKTQALEFARHFGHEATCHIVAAHKFRYQPTPAPEVPFSLPLRSHPEYEDYIDDASGKFLFTFQCEGDADAIAQRDYIISAVNSHEELKRQLEQWTKWGVVEVAVRNPQVADYCNHWEGRTERAESQVEELKRERDEARRYGQTEYRIEQILRKDLADIQEEKTSLLSLNAKLREALKRLKDCVLTDDMGEKLLAIQQSDAVLDRAEKAVRP